MAYQIELWLGELWNVSQHWQHSLDHYRFDAWMWLAGLDKPNYLSRIGADRPSTADDGLTSDDNAPTISNARDLGSSVGEEDEEVLLELIEEEVRWNIQSEIPSLRYISSTSVSKHSFPHELPSTLSNLSTNDVKVSITGPSTPNNEGTTNANSIFNNLMTRQSRLTNIGLDNPQCHGYYFWSIFQSIYWHHILKEHAKQHGDDPNAHKMDQETVQAEFYAEYAKVPPDDPDLTDEEMEERKTLREEIKKEYKVLQEEEEVNVSGSLYDFKNYCSIGEIQVQKKQEEAMGTKVTKIPWDKWWHGMVENQRPLVNAFTVEEGKKTCIKSWTIEESSLAKSLPESMHADNANWLKIPLVVDNADRLLLTIGKIEDQCKTCSGRNIKLVVKAKSPAGDEVMESQQPWNPPIDTNAKTTKQCKAGKGAPAPAPDAKPKS
ncbi:hypothetical protein M422DRAFT_274656 [Sphaerobolus stellatus SS14]|uniref:Uncharacterized protein n=1 Tax=Sphaerobolus stellatus (strain SS14) TaxID=990650 RepID=A0A0C9UGJ3_SPHS4|nr:hypothetical protein M422DRAFT_274656 [Sphaerobolus stellatus SS14]